MNKNENKEPRTCPKCGKEYTAYPALSRIDNETLICPDCGIREALESIGIEADEREKILQIVNAHCKCQNT